MFEADAVFIGGARWPWRNEADELPLGVEEARLSQCSGMTPEWLSA